MGEMSSTIGGIMNATKGPADPGVQQTTPATAGPYSPTARTGNMMASLAGGSSMSDAPPMRLSAVGRQPDVAESAPVAPPPVSTGPVVPVGSGTDFTRSPGGPIKPGTGALTDYAGGVPDQAATPAGQDRYNIPAMIGVANSTAQLARGLVGDMSRGPAGSPLAPRSV